jgi:hypothetical protein
VPLRRLEAGPGWDELAHYWSNARYVFGASAQQHERPCHREWPGLDERAEGWALRFGQRARVRENEACTTALLNIRPRYAIQR